MTFRLHAGNQKQVIWVKLKLLYDAGGYNLKYIKGLVMARALACLGDETRYGEIITATASWFEGSKAIARTGDKASCSKCNGYFEIPASAQDWAEERKAYAATGDRVLCRCPDHSIYGSASQFTSTGTGSLSSRNTAQSAVPAQQAKDSGARNCIRFQCAGDDGQQMAGCRYTLIFPDGRSKRALPINMALRNGIMLIRLKILTCIYFSGEAGEPLLFRVKRDNET